MNGPRGDMKPETGPTPDKSATVPQKPEKDEWVPVEGRKHLFKSRLTGKLKYIPPDPSISYPWPFPTYIP